MFIFDCDISDICFATTHLVYFAALKVRSQGRFAYANAELLSHFVASHYPTHTLLSSFCFTK